MNESQEELEKVYVDLPNHWAVGGESMWAKSLGNNLFEICNAPFYAYGLNWGDVVRAESAESNLKPEVLEVVKPSGNKTLRIYFAEKADENSQTEYLKTLKQFKVSYERANDNLVALDIEPDADYDALCDKLWKLEQEGILEYETCESRVQNKFDDEPEED
ncbi:MAG: hypothetical protein AVDCRST_MAG74-42 [uncultured Pyrinomonadaceae bacterium]|uniref:DUF4265 domain-containing protein n=1 Tax=uncultured Pyrinomonadaceae bacterium TaxID=2283094 RepID=A0A6J4N3R3_9BACT|nr:MAG: hypothetical protein AVDCRST_MAG74-42 [uncultured Pyrinomonadaceae bacterium]